MKVRRVQIGRFKQMKDVSFEVPNDTGLICLTGENGSGKTTVLRVISSALSHLGLAQGGSDPLLSDDDDAYNFSVLMDFSDEPDELWTESERSLEVFGFAGDTASDRWDKMLEVEVDLRLDGRQPLFSLSIRVGEILVWSMAVTSPTGWFIGLTKRTSLNICDSTRIGPTRHILVGLGGQKRSDN